MLIVVKYTLEKGANMNIKDDENILPKIDNKSLFKVSLDYLDLLNESLDYKFSDLFDLSEIQVIQDAFSSATGVASIITEIDGTPITKPSNFSCFCYEIIRKTEKGLKNCMLSDSILGSPKKDGPRIQKCLSGGLMDGGASIMVGDKHIANWLIGQIMDEEYNTDSLLSYADEIGVEHKIFLNALDKVTRMPKQQFADICNFLFLTAQQLSKLAIKNVIKAHEISKRKIAEQEIKILNDELGKKIFERTYQLEEINGELEETNAMLEEEVSERQKAEEEIKRINSQLEAKVAERTYQLEETNAELEETNSILEEEIEERIRTEEALKRELAFNNALLENVLDGVVACDMNENLTLFNATAREWHGVDATKLPKNEWAEYYDLYQKDGITPLDTNEIPLVRAFNGEVVHEAEMVICAKDKPARHIHANGRSFCDSSGKKLGAVVIMRDFTERIKAEEELKKAKDDAENANRAKSQFLANMSHEIRTPMNGIIGMTDLTLMTELADEQRDYLNVVKSSTQSLLRVLNDILDYSKIEAGKMNLEILSFDIRNTINEVINLFNVTAKQKGLYVKLTIDDRIPKNIIGDSVRLRQVISNLIGNGIKFTSKGGIFIKVDCEELIESTMKIKLMVSDTGIGISEENVEMLFQRFSQVDDSNTRQFGGTGLGLAISKKLVEMMGGEIGVNSKENIGSDFYFTVMIGVQTDVKFSVKETQDSAQFYIKKTLILKKFYSLKMMR